MTEGMVVDHYATSSQSRQIDGHFTLSIFGRLSIARGPEWGRVLPGWVVGLLYVIYSHLCRI